MHSTDYLERDFCDHRLRRRSQGPEAFDAFLGLVGIDRDGKRRMAQVMPDRPAAALRDEGQAQGGINLHSLAKSGLKPYIAQRDFTVWNLIARGS